MLQVWRSEVSLELKFQPWSILVWVPPKGEPETQTRVQVA